MIKAQAWSNRIKACFMTDHYTVRIFDNESIKIITIDEYWYFEFILSCSKVMSEAINSIDNYLIIFLLN